MSGIDKSAMSSGTEDRYLELEKERDNQAKKRDRIEQARRNFEALSKFAGYIADADRFDNKKEIVEALNANVKVMGEVTKL